MNSSILRMDGIPFWKSSVGNIEESILSKIYEIEKEFPTERYSNINGYQSQANIYLIKEFRPLFETVMRLASAASVDMKFAPCSLILKMPGSILIGVLVHSINSMYMEIFFLEFYI